MSCFSVGQMNQLGDKLEEMGWDAPRVTQLGQATPEQYRAIEAILEGRAKVEKNRLLSDPTTFTLPAVKEPKRLKDREGVWLSLGAAALFAMVERLPAASERTIVRRDLLKPLNDFETVQELGGQDAAVFKSVVEMELAIGQLIDATEAGSDDLLTNMANIGYVADPENHERLLYVRVCQSGVAWRVDCRPAGADGWVAGRRVLKQLPL